MNPNDDGGAGEVGSTIARVVTVSDGETALAKLIRQAEQPSVRIEATKAPFEAKDVLKARGYRWHAEKRTWWTEIATAGEAGELDWLRDACSCTQPKLTPVTWAERHRG